MPITMSTALHFWVAIDAMTAVELLESDFVVITDLVRAHARERGDATALSDPNRTLSWRELDDLIERVAARLQSEGVGRGGTVAIGGYNSIGYVLAFFGALRAGAAAALLTTSASAQSLNDMLADSRAKHVFLDANMAARLTVHGGVQAIAYDDAGLHTPLTEWMASAGTRAAPVDVQP